MTQRFETLYRVKRRDNLGDPDYWNLRLQDVDRRVDANETALQSLDDVAARIEGTALDRINLIVTPLVQETIERVKTIPSLFVATASNTVTIATGALTFIVDPGLRNTFAHMGYIRANPTGDFSRGILGSVTSFNALDGTLNVVVELAWGSGTYSNWSLAASLPANANVTPQQIGAPTVAQMNTAIAQAKADIIGTASPAGDTLGELEAAQTAATAFAISMAVAL